MTKHYDNSRVARLIDRDHVDLLDWYKIALGQDFCDTLADCRSGLLQLPAAVALVEQLTGRSINRSTYELTGSDCANEIRLPHAPVCDLLSFEYRRNTSSDDWLLVDPSTYAFVNSEVCPRVEINNWDHCCGSSTKDICTSNECCDRDVWRIRYMTGTKAGCEITTNPLLLQSVMVAAQWLDSQDEQTHQTLMRLIKLAKVHLFAGSNY